MIAKIIKNSGLKFVQNLIEPLPPPHYAKWCAVFSICPWMAYIISQVSSHGAGSLMNFQCLVLFYLLVF